MCLYTQRGIDIASEDIICYKILYRRRFRFPRSPFRHKLYIRNIKYKVEEIQTRPMYVCGIKIVTVGFHSYTNLHDALNEFYQMQKSWINYENLALYKCIIPKSSFYYLGDDRYNFNAKNNIHVDHSKMYVSNQIIVKYKIKHEKI